MDQIGTKHKLLFINGSRLIIITWLLYASISSLIINQGINIRHLINSYLFYSLFFLPLYFLLINIIIKKDYKKRILIALCSLIPIIISYIILFIKMCFLTINPVKAIFLLIILFLIKMILAIEKKLYILITSVLINILFVNYIYLMYVIKYIKLPKYQLISLYITDYYLFDTYLIMILFIETILIISYYFVILNKYRKGDNNARNS